MYLIKADLAPEESSITMQLGRGGGGVATEIAFIESMKPDKADAVRYTISDIAVVFCSDTDIMRDYNFHGQRPHQLSLR